jgi:hypothetical protein
MGLMVPVACVGEEKINEYRVSLESLRERECLEEPGVECIVVLKLALKS